MYKFSKIKVVEIEVINLQLEQIKELELREHSVVNVGHKSDSTSIPF